MAAKNDISDLRSRVSALEQDNELLMGIIMKMSNIFELSGINNPKEDVPFNKISNILKRIANGDPLTPTQIATINKYSDPTMYNTTPFKNMIVSRFDTIFYRINQGVSGLSFEDTMKHIDMMSTMDNKILTHAYILTLKSKNLV